MRIIITMLLTLSCFTANASGFGVVKDHAVAVLPKPVVHSPQQSLKLDTFTGIDASNWFVIRVTGGAKRQSVVVKAAPEYSRHVDAYVIGDTLYLRYKDWWRNPPHRIPVVIHMKRLNRIMLAGNAGLYGNHINSKHLTIAAKGDGNINLYGMMRLTNLSQQGSGQIHCRWVNTPDLKIVSIGSGLITLAGRANLLHAKLYDHARLDTRYLRVGQAWVSTRQKAAADVLATHHLNAFASDIGNVNFFKTPQHLADHPEGSGNVLQLGHWR